MKIKVNYLGPLLAASGIENQAFELPEGATTFDVIDAVVEAHPEMAAALRGASGGPAGGMLMVIDAEAVSRTQPTPVADGDEVTLMPAIGGG